MGFTVATGKKRRCKMFTYGPEGTLKTRVALRLGSGKDPALMAVVDTERGTDHYVKEFNFSRISTSDPVEIFKEIKALVKEPGRVRTLCIDSISVYHEAMVSKFCDIYLKRETTSKGNKRDYYKLQPADYQPINREVGKLIRLLLESDLNIIVTAHAKDRWGDDMKVAGTTFDGWKKLAFYFDTVLEIQKAADGTMTLVCHKDRTNGLKEGARLPWKNDKDAYKTLKKAFGGLADSEAATGWDDLPEEPVTGVDDTAAPHGLAKDLPAPKVEPNTPAGNQQAETTVPDDERAALCDQIITLRKSLNVRRPAWLEILKAYNVVSATDPAITVDNLKEIIATMEKKSSGPTSEGKAAEPA